MEIGPTDEEMVFDDFNQTYQWITNLNQRAHERNLLSASEYHKLKHLQTKMRLYVDAEPAKLDSAKRKIKFLLKRYSTYYDA